MCTSATHDVSEKIRIEFTRGQLQKKNGPNDSLGFRVQKMNEPSSRFPFSGHLAHICPQSRTSADSVGAFLDKRNFLRSPLARDLRIGSGSMPFAAVFDTRPNAEGLRGPLADLGSRWGSRRQGRRNTIDQVYCFCARRDFNTWDSRPPSNLLWFFVYFDALGLRGWPLAVLKQPIETGWGGWAEGPRAEGRGELSRTDAA